MLDVWPCGIQSALDVGCGDGKVTSHLTKFEGLRLVGLDSSEEALSRLPYPGVKGDAQALPFEDGAFDVTMSTDALEHMPEAEENKAWAELFRVAAKAVMVAVPFREELLDATACCEACGHHYHVNWHERSYDIDDLHRRAPTGWRVRATILSGEAWSAMLPPETHLRRNALDEWSGWEAAMCPRCASAGSKAPELAPLPSLLARSLGRLIYPALTQRRYCRSHSEILVIFEREDASLELPHLPPAETFAQCASNIDLHRQPPCENLQPYSQVAQYVAGADGRWRAQFPLYQAQPQLSVTRLPGSTAELHLLLEDEAGCLFEGSVLEAGQEQCVITLSRAPVPGYYGILASFDAKQPFASIRLGTGPTVYRSHGNLDASCRYLALNHPRGALYVQCSQPLWFDPASLETRAPVPEPTVPQVLAEMERRLEHALAVEAGEQSKGNLSRELNELRVQVQNLSAERDGLLDQARELQRIAVDIQNLRAERDALLERAHEADRLAVDLQNITAERDHLQSRMPGDAFASPEYAILQARAVEAERLEVDVQNLQAERDALLLRAREADQQAVALQNLEAERDALLVRAREADRLAVEIQNLTSERDLLQLQSAAESLACAESSALQARAAEADRLAVDVQNLQAERDSLVLRIREADQQAVALQNLEAERDALLARAYEADRFEVQIQNLGAEREALLLRAAEADRLAVELQNLTAEHEIYRARIAEAEHLAVRAENLVAERDALMLRATEADIAAVKIQNFVAEQSALWEQLHTALAEITQLEGQRSSLADQIRDQDLDHSKKLNQMQAVFADLQEQIGHLNNRSQEAEQSLENLQAVLNQAETDKKQLQEALQVCQLRLGQLSQHLENRLGAAVRNALARLRGKK
ncbi:methyltransferase domain-containing protein [Pseudomonas soli]|uniref:methyltransferase domain-containing protein n=1 Tax=Pseudomonas soli TaxID=1306993 RepID=UPI0028A8C103|nr:methyltransferase domain-containing protein [Pseudomonas soli]